MPKLREAILDTISKACKDESTSLQPAHVKDILKLVLVAVRQTKRLAQNTDELSTIWQPSKWSELSSTLASNDRFKASVGLQAMCKQIVQLLQESGTAGSKAKTADENTAKSKKSGASTTKRKAADREEDGDEGVADEGKKAKHKKARKAKSS